MPGQGGFAVSSKLLQKKWEERAYQNHRQKMLSMKSNLSGPRHYNNYPHLVLRLKKVQKEEERQAEIDNENQILLNKMTNIMKKRGRVDNWNEYPTRSYHTSIRERQQEKIAEENLALARRLGAIQPMYDVSEWEDDYHRHAYYLDLWGNSTKDYDMISPRSKRKGQGHESRQEDTYDSDFEDDDDTQSNRLPKIESRNNSSQATNQQKKESSVTKLPSINKTEKNKKKGQTDNKSKKDALADQDAKLLFKACKGLTKPDEAILKALIRRSHAQRMATKARFQELYDLDLEAELKRSLSPEYAPLIECLLGEREGHDADNINSLLHNNDVAGLINVICSRNQAAMNNINKSYKQSFDVSIEDDIRDRILDEDCQRLLLALLKGNKNKGSLDKELADDDATELNEAGYGRFSDSDGKFLELLEKRSFPQIKATFASYKKVSGENIEESMKKDGCSKEYCNAVQTLAKGMNTGASLNAELIHDLIKSRKNKELISLLMARGEIDLPEIRKAYKKKYGSELINDIMAKCGKEVGPLIAHLAAVDGKGGGKQEQGKGKGKSSAMNPPKKTPAKQPDSKKDGNSKDTAKTKPGSKPAEQQKQPAKPQQKQQQQQQKQQPAKPKQEKSNSALKDQTKEKDKTMEKEEKDKTKEKEEKDKTKEKDQTKGKDQTKEKESKLNGTVKGPKDFNPESDADKIHEAVEGFGTDEQVLIDILANRTNAQRQQIKKQYKEKYDKDLMDVMTSELRGDFEEVMLALLMTPVEYDAYCIHDAVEGPGTKEAALIGIICTRTPKELKAIKAEFKKTYDSDIDDKLQGDTSGEFEAMLLELSKGERDTGQEVDDKMAESDAQNLIRPGEEAIDVSSEAFRNLLCKKNKAQLRATFQHYEKLSGQSIDEGIDKAWIELGDTADGYAGLAEAIQDTADFYAKRLNDSMSGIGTNDNQLIRIIVSRSEIDLGDIKVKYNDLTGKTLAQNIESETSGDYKKMLLAIVNSAKKKKLSQTSEDSGRKGKATFKNRRPGSPSNSHKSSVISELNKPSTRSRNLSESTSVMTKSTNARDLSPISTRSKTQTRTGDDKIVERSKPYVDVLKTKDRKPLKLVRKPSERRIKSEMMSTADSQSVISMQSGLSKKPREAQQERQRMAAYLKNKQEEEKAIEKAKPKELSDAEKLHKAFECQETDLAMIVSVLGTKTKASRQELRNSYKKKYKKDLISVVEENLRGDFQHLVVAMLMPSAEYDAECLQVSVVGFRTNEAFIRSDGMLVSRTNKELKEIADWYLKAYEKDLQLELKADTSIALQDLVMKLASGTRMEDEDVDKITAYQTAKLLYNSGEPRLNPVKEAVFKDLLTISSYKQIQLTLDSFIKISEKQLEESMKECGITEKALINTVHCLHDPIQYFCERLHQSLRGTGTDSTALIRILVTREEKDLDQVKQRYQEMFGRTLERQIEKDCPGHYKDLLLALVGTTHH